MSSLELQSSYKKNPAHPNKGVSGQALKSQPILKYLAEKLLCGGSALLRRL
jgi:hypothetical protein